MNTTENNIKIAEFMGGTIEQLLKENDTLYFIKDGVCMGKPKWDSSWDWLMPVVEKIESTFDVKVTMSNYSGKYRTCMDTQNYTLNIECRSNKSRFDSVYSAVIAFIDWYNSK